VCTHHFIHSCSHCCTCRCGVHPTVMMSAMQHVIIRFTLSHCYGWPYTVRLMSGLIARDCNFQDVLNCLCLQCMPVELLAHITHSLTSLNHSFTDNHRTADPLSRAVSALCHVRSAVHGVHWQTAQFMACTGRQRNSWHAVAVSACRLHKHTSSRTAHRESLCECLSQTYALTAATTTTAAAI
jgi:hypothetical protein